jgi:PLP dependent protein
MAISKENFKKLLSDLSEQNVTLVAVSKIQPISKILQLYELGHRDFGENYVQELVDKYERLPNDIKWHFIGHLQTNKVKYIASFVHLVHGVDSYKLLKEINKQAEKNNRVINVLLQIHIATEDTKFGLHENELEEILNQLKENPLNHVHIKGLMGMASFSENLDLVRNEFKNLKRIFDACKERENVDFTILSMGMSGDYEIAIAEGSNMVRIGSMLFGARA